MATFDIPDELLTALYERDPNNKGFSRIRKILHKSVRNWLKHRKIEFTFEYEEIRTQIDPGQEIEVNGRKVTFGRRWQVERRQELIIPDELWALQFKLTWL